MTNTHRTILLDKIIIVINSHIKFNDTGTSTKMTYINHKWHTEALHSTLMAMFLQQEGHLPDESCSRKCFIITLYDSECWKYEKRWTVKCCTVWTSLLSTHVVGRLERVLGLAGLLDRLLSSVLRCMKRTFDARLWCSKVRAGSISFDMAVRGDEVLSQMHSTFTKK